MNRGYVKLWRKTKNSPVWQMPPLYSRVWTWIIMSVNYDKRTIPTPTGEITVNPGQRITSLRQIADEVSWYEYGVLKTPNVKTIKSILDWLESNGQCTAESNSKGTVITVMNWDTYNGNSVEEVTQKEQVKVTAKERTPDTNKKEKKEPKKKEEDKEKRIADFEIFWNTFAYKQGKGGAEKAWLAITDYTDELLNKIIEAAKNEAQRRPSLITQSRTPKWAQGWLNERRWEDEPYKGSVIPAGFASKGVMGALERSAALRQKAMEQQNEI